MGKKWVIDTDTAAFIANLPGRHYSERSFRDAMAGVLLHDALLGYGDIAKELAQKLQIAPTTVYRWARCVPGPATGMRKIAVRTAAAVLARRAKESAEEQRAAHAAFRRLTVDLQSKPPKK